MLWVIAIIAIAVLAVIAAVAVAGLIAVRNKASFERDSRLGTGLATSAPTAWAGSHDPEARLHRRLRDAVAALSANQSFDMDGRLIDLRVELEQQAMALDEQLVATAALPMHVRAEPLGRISAAVEALEHSVADLAGASAGATASRLDQTVQDVRARTGLVDEARRALDALDEVSGEQAVPPPPGPAVSPGRAAPPAPGRGASPGPAVSPGPTGGPAKPDRSGTDETTPPTSEPTRSPQPPTDPPAGAGGGAEAG